MAFYLPSNIQYTPEQAVWGPPTSTLNFCEEDYEFTPFIAELFNTLTNVTYIGLGIHGLYRTRVLRLPGIGPKLPYFALIHLGLMSSSFHSTLKYPMQLCDESAMIIATFIVFYQLLCFSQTRFSPTQLLVGLSAAAMVVVIAQYVTGESTVQQIVFTTMVYWLWHTCFKMIGKIQGNNGVKNGMWWMAVSGIGFFVTGHGCWVTDFKACDGLRSMRAQIGMPWAAVLELHGFWHIFTGIGVYIFMVLVECLRFVQPSTEKGRPQLVSCKAWPFMVRLKIGTAAEEKKHA